MHKEATGVADKVTGFEIPVEDEERAARFFRNVFGWKIDTGEQDHAHVETVEVDSEWAPKERGAVNGMMYRRTAKTDRVALMITVDSIAETIRKIKAQGGRVITEKSEAGTGWWAEVTDSEGNLFELWEDRE